MQDTLEIIVEDDNDTSLVSLVASGHTYRQVSLPPTIVNEFVEQKRLSREVMEMLIRSHPAGPIVNDLMSVISHMTSVSDPDAVDAFRDRTLTALRSMGYAPQQ